MFQTTNQYRLVQEKSLTSSQRKKLHITSWPGCQGHSDSTWFVTYGPIYNQSNLIPSLGFFHWRRRFASKPRPRTHMKPHLLTTCLPALN
jgi:hypothetical protein